tara:strand:+ start:498 stop:941 length:444 start_codon:yes stop_codon:yes gene_type:complete
LTEDWNKWLKDMFDETIYETDDLTSPIEVKDLINKYGKASIFTYALYSDITEGDIFVITKGLYVALRCNDSIVLPKDFERNMLIIEAKEDKEKASLFGRVENTNLNIVLGGCFQEHYEYIQHLVLEGLQYMQVECEFIGFFEVESNV